MNRRRAKLGIASAARIILFGIGLGVSTALRAARLFPNNDPIMAVTLPYAKRGRLAAVAFPVLAIVLFDLLSKKVGVWTLVTAGIYGALGLGFSALYAALTERGRPVGRGVFFLSGVAGVLVYDFLTGPLMSSALFRISFVQAFVGQIPFTLKHLASVSLYTLAVSPLVDGAIEGIERSKGRLLLRLDERDRLREATGR